VQHVVHVLGFDMEDGEFKNSGAFGGHC
jgi:hypothetical protein